jgi:hypothetical protein
MLAMPAALRGLQKALRTAGPSALAELLQLTPHLTALTALWDNSKDNAQVTSGMLMLLADVLTASSAAQAQEASDAGNYPRPCRQLGRANPSQHTVCKNRHVASTAACLQEKPWCA